jgi:hypothetical protein
MQNQIINLRLSKLISTISRALLITLHTLVLHSNSIHTFCSKGNFPFIKTTWFTELFVKYINGRLRRWIHSKFCPIASLYSFHTSGFTEPQDTSSFFFSAEVAIFLTAERLVANQCSCMYKLWFKTVTL